MERKQIQEAIQYVDDNIRECLELEDDIFPRDFVFNIDPELLTIREVLVDKFNNFDKKPESWQTIKLREDISNMMNSSTQMYANRMIFDLFNK